MIYAFRATMKRDGAKSEKFAEKLVDPKLGGIKGKFWVALELSRGFVGQFHFGQIDQNAIEGQKEDGNEINSKGGENIQINSNILGILLCYFGQIFSAKLSHFQEFL